MNALKIAPLALKGGNLFSGSTSHPSSLPFCLRALKNVLLTRRTHSLNSPSVSHSIHLGFSHLSDGKLLCPFKYHFGQTPLPVINYVLDSLFTFMENHFKKWYLEHSAGSSSSISGTFQQKSICRFFFASYTSFFPFPLRMLEIL